MTTPDLRAFDLSALGALLHPEPAPSWPLHHGHGRWEDDDAWRRWTSGWEALAHTLALPAWDKRADAWLDQVSDALDARWPAEARRWPEPWMRRAVAPRATRLARGLSLGELSAATQARLMAQLSAMPARDMPPLTNLTFARVRYPRRRPAPGAEGALDEAQVALLARRLEGQTLRRLAVLGGESMALWQTLAQGQTAWLTGLQRLAVSLYVNPWHDPALVGGALEALLGAAQLGELRELDLFVRPRGEHGLTARMVERLLMHHSERLEALTLSRLPHAALLDELIGSPWPALRALSVHMDAPMSRLCAWLERAARVESLRVSGHLESDMTWLGRGQPLRELALIHTRQSVDALTKLLSSPRCAELETLTLWMAPVHGGLIEAIHALPLKRLTLKTLDQAGLDQALAQALPGRCWPTLQALHLTPQRLDALVGLDAPQLSVLSAQVEQADAAGARALGQASWLGQLGSLRLELRRSDEATRAQLRALGAQLDVTL